jgi:oligopeptide transport system permease protein
MLNLIIRRLIQLPIILLVIYTLTLTLAWSIPGNPLENSEGRQPPAEVAEAMKRQYNLDSFWTFYGSYLYNVSGAKYAVEELSGRAGQERRAAQEAGRPSPHLTPFDMGPSLKYTDWRVSEIISGSLPVSMALGAVAMIIALLLGMTAGVIGAIRPNSAADLGTLAVALVGISLPSFVIGTVLLLVFPVLLGIGQVAAWGRVQDMILPAFTLSLPFAAYIARLTRMGMIDVLSQDFIRTARAKGVSEMRVLLKHGLKNAFLPVLSYLGPATALAMTGSFVVEKVFSVPGMGQHFVEAVRNKDLFLIIGVVLVFSTMLILLNMVVDVLYRWVDPRIT